MAIFQVFGGFGDLPGDPLRGYLGWYIAWCTHVYAQRGIQGPLGIHGVSMVCIWIRSVSILVRNGLRIGAISETQA